MIEKKKKKKPEILFRKFFQADCDPKTMRIIKQAHAEVDARRKKLGLPPWCWTHSKSSEKCSCQSDAVTAQTRAKLFP